MTILPPGTRTFDFRVSVPSGSGVVLGPSGATGVTHAIGGLPAQAPVLGWQVMASADNADNAEVKRGAEPFVEQADGLCANYVVLPPDRGDQDDLLSEGPHNQCLRARSSGAGAVVIFGRVVAQVSR